MKEKRYLIADIGKKYPELQDAIVGPNVIIIEPIKPEVKPDLSVSTDMIKTKNPDVYVDHPERGLIIGIGDNAQTMLHAEPGDIAYLRMDWYPIINPDDPNRAIRETARYIMVKDKTYITVSMGDVLLIQKNN